MLSPDIDPPGSDSDRGFYFWFFAETLDLLPKAVAVSHSGFDDKGRF